MFHPNFILSGSVLRVGTPPLLDSYPPPTWYPGSPQRFSLTAPVLMSFRDLSTGALAWLRALFTNLYFWGGLALLVGLGVGAYLVIDGIVMPSYTRHQVSTTVPNVEDLPFEKAKTQLQAQNLRVERQVGRYNPNVDTGVVVDQTPLPSSKVKPGRRVYLTVNSGEVPTIRIPDLSGMSIREAKNRLSSLGLVVDSVKEDEVPSPYANTITKQKPEPGDSLQEGEPVSLWYSTGLGDEMVGVPNVVGLSVDEAQRFLLQQDLRGVVVDTSTTSEESPDDADRSEKDLFVRQQAHPPGDSLRAGTEVRLYTTTDAQKAAARRKEVKADSAAGGSTTN